MRGSAFFPAARWKKFQGAMGGKYKSCMQLRDYIDCGIVAQEFLLMEFRKIFQCIFNEKILQNIYLIISQ